MSDTLPGIAPVSITCSITPAAPVDRWTVEGVDFHGNIVREVYDVPRGERVVTNMREVRTIHMETVEPGKVTVSNPDRAQIALLGASRPGAGLVGLAYTIGTVSPDVDAAPPAAQETKS